MVSINGARLKSVDLLKTGLANYYVESKNILDLKSHLIENSSKDHQRSYKFNK